jgi:hypothetical protein
MEVERFPTSLTEDLSELELWLGELAGDVRRGLQGTRTRVDSITV